jgi:hypothetical protein
LWGGAAPGNRESAGQKKHSDGERESAHQDGYVRSSFGRSQDAKHDALRQVLEVALAHKFLTIIYHMLKSNQSYIEGVTVAQTAI